MPARAWLFLMQLEGGRLRTWGLRVRQRRSQRRRQRRRQQRERPGGRGRPRRQRRLPLGARCRRLPLSPAPLRTAHRRKHRRGPRTSPGHRVMGPGPFVQRHHRRRPWPHPWQPQHPWPGCCPAARGTSSPSILILTLVTMSQAPRLQRPKAHRSSRAAKGRQRRHSCMQLQQRRWRPWRNRQRQRCLSPSRSGRCTKRCCLPCTRPRPCVLLQHGCCRPFRKGAMGQSRTPPHACCSAAACWTCARRSRVHMAWTSAPRTSRAAAH
mmetsp:Transcript_16612/g.45675  ORF Transcript_16612/g.45675 Transcript_16612/m.45675 type:complete len:267 (+) Transcript_16612:754-1554(+)